MADVEPDAKGGAQPSLLVTGRLITLRFIKDALRRRRWLWISVAVLGLVGGIGFHLVIPIKYAASATLYLADPPGSAAGSSAPNDLALLQTAEVGQQAIKLLGEPGLNPLNLLGKTPGVSVSPNIMTITIDGPTTQEAIRRVNAVATAFLSVRYRQYGAQTAAIDSALDQQINALNSQVTSLTNVINGIAPVPSGETLANVVSERAQDSTSILSLQQTVQENQLGQLSTAKGSRVITPGAVTPSRKIKLFGLDGASGLVAGLGLGMGFVLVQAFTSDRLRRREDIADVLGAPVDLSVGRVRIPRTRARTSSRLLHLAEKPTPPIQAIVQHLRSLLPPVGSGQTLLLVAVDDTEVPAVVMATLASRLTASGKTVVLVDLTANKVLGHMFRVHREGRHQVRIGGVNRVILLVPSGEWRTEENESAESAAMPWSSADVVLAVATADPAVGAWHLGHWANKATVLVTAGRSSAQRINGTAELLRAASIGVASAILVNADSYDDSVGLSDSGEPLRSVKLSPPNWT
jgi:hypothetical protein